MIEFSTSYSLVPQKNVVPLSPRMRLNGRIMKKLCKWKGEDNAALTDLMNTYFSHANLPIGLERNGVKNP